MTGTEAHQLTDADLLTFAVIFEWRVRQHRQGIKWLAMPFPPCPTCQAEVREMVVSEAPWMMGNSILLAPCQHRYKVTDDDMLRVAEHAQNMLDDIEWNDRRGKDDSAASIAAEARARLGEESAVTTHETASEQPAAGDRSSGKPRAGEPSGPADRP